MPIAHLARISSQYEVYSDADFLVNWDIIDIVINNVRDNPSRGWVFISIIHAML